MLSRDDMLDNIMLYWLTNTATSSARYYWENGQAASQAYSINIPVCVSRFTRSALPERAPRNWTEYYYKNIVYWNDVERGGHFAAWEQPELFVNELRDAFRQFR